MGTPMTAKASVFIATSLDGFIARPNGDLDWLDQANTTVTEGEDCGYTAFMDTVDILIMGRNTYEKVLTFGPWPYEKPVIVLSRNPIDIPPEIANAVTHSSETPEALHTRLTAEGARRLYIDGGITIQRFLNAGLITDLTITLIPVILGNGIPLFGSLQQDIPLTHTETLSYPFGFVQLKYEALMQRTQPTGVCHV